MVDESGIPGQGLTLVVLAAGVLFLAGGLIFLCATVQNAGRLPVSLALLVIGGGLAGGAGWRWRRAAQLSPRALAQRITELAAARDAEVTLAQVISELSVPADLARAALARLETNGLSRRERREDREIYTFPGLLEGKVVRRCTYCGSEYSVRQPLQKCSNCGGQLELVKE